MRGSTCTNWPDLTPAQRTVQCPCGVRNQGWMRDCQHLCNEAAHAAVRTLPPSVLSFTDMLGVFILTCTDLSNLCFVPAAGHHHQPAQVQSLSQNCRCLRHGRYHDSPGDRSRPLLLDQSRSVARSDLQLIHVVQTYEVCLASSPDRSVRWVIDGGPRLVGGVDMC